MARHVHNVGLDSRSARLKLKTVKIHRQGLGGKLDLGWRRAKNGAGRWIARRYLGDEKYATETIGEADDLADANGDTVLNFDQAQTKARAWASGLDEKARIESLGPPVSIRSAVNEYLNERSTALDARGKLKHLFADKTLAEKPIAALTVGDLAKWRASLLKKLTEASARRVANDVRACLNAAARRHREKLPPSIRDTIHDGLAVSRGVKVDNEREKQILSVADIKRLIEATMELDREKGWGSDLVAMLVALAATGARFSQVARLRVVDLQVEQGRLMMPTSRKGSGSKAVHIPVPLDDDVITVLKRSIAGRKGHEPLLMRPRWRHARGPGMGMEIYERAKWKEASELTRPWEMIVERAGLQDDLVPYSLRHSSITRGLSAGLPTQLVAQLHDSSVTMIERFYGRFVADALHGLARSVVVPIMPTPVKTLRVVEG
jgi:integrase